MEASAFAAWFLSTLSPLRLRAIHRDYSSLRMVCGWRFARDSRCWINIEA